MVAIDDEAQVEGIARDGAQNGHGQLDLQHAAECGLDAVGCEVRGQGRAHAVAQLPGGDAALPDGHLQLKIGTGLVAVAKRQVQGSQQSRLGQGGGEIQSRVKVLLVYAGVQGLQQEEAAMHAAAAAVTAERCRAHPVEVAAHLAVNRGMHVGRLRREGRTGQRTADGPGKMIGRHAAERGVDVGKMLAVKLVEVAVVGRVMLGTVPPVPVATLGDEQLLPGEGALLGGGLGGVFVVKVAGLAEVIPTAIVLRRADPDVEVGVDPRSRDESAQGAEGLRFLPRDGLADGDRLDLRILLE